MHMPRLSARRARSVATAKASATSYKPARPIADDGRGRHERKRASGGGRANTTATASDLAASVSRSFSRSRCTVAGRGRPIRGGSGRDGDQWERGGFSNSISPLQFINVNFFLRKFSVDFVRRRPCPNSRPQPRGEWSRETKERERERESRLPRPSPLSSCLFLAKLQWRATAAILRTNERWLLAPKLHVPTTQNT